MHAYPIDYALCMYVCMYVVCMMYVCMYPTMNEQEKKGGRRIKRKGKGKSDLTQTCRITLLRL